MHYEFVAIPDEEVPQAADPLFQRLVTTYASETNKTASLWRAVPDGLLAYRPHEKTNTIRAILVHQILSERRFFAQFVGTEEPPRRRRCRSVRRPQAAPPAPRPRASIGAGRAGRVPAPQLRLEAAEHGRPIAGGAPRRSVRRSVAIALRDSPGRSGRREWAARPDASVVAPRYHGGWTSPES
jgi:hypothetical protein